MPQLYLVRHGQTDWNLERRIMGHLPIALNSEGRNQSEALAKHMCNHPLDAIQFSPMQRCRETAEIIAECHSGKFASKLKSNDAIREIDYGTWVGKTFDEINAQPDYIPYYLQPQQRYSEGAENLLEVQARMYAEFEKLKTLPKDYRVLWVSHADSIKCLLLKLLGIPFEYLWKLKLANASLSQIEIFQNEGYIVHGINQVFY